jgi:hypothetical protein
MGEELSEMLMIGLVAFYGSGVFVLLYNLRKMR